MNPRFLMPLAAALLASCSRSPQSPSAPPQFGAYHDSGGNYRFEAPKDWAPETDGERNDKPVVSVFFRGRENAGGTAQPIDVAVSVTKLSRRQEDFPSKEEFDNFRRSTLLQVDALFGPPDQELQEPLRSLVAKNAKDIAVGGLSGKTYRRDYDYVDPRFPSSKPLPISLEEVVLKTPEAYFVLEYRARRDLFDKYHFAADRLKASFQPGRTAS